MSAAVDCPHGEVHPSACLECVDGVPAERPKLSASRTIEARMPGQCARDESHYMAPGDTIHNVPGLGWCCGRCARPRQGLETQHGRTWQATGWIWCGVQIIEHRSRTQMWCKTCGAVADLPAAMSAEKIKAAISAHIRERHPENKDTTT